MTRLVKTEAAHRPTEPDGKGLVPDNFEIGHISSARARAASEIGAAMAHELNGPMTALLLYIGDIQQSGGRLVDASGDSESLKHVFENVYREAERVCNLIHRMGDSFEAPIVAESAIAVGRDAIAWWSRAGDSAGKARTEAGNHGADEPGRSGAKPLTPREQEVLRLVSRGYSNKEGAMLMKISYRTFECHRAEVMRKLGARNTAELVRRALLNSTDSCPSAEWHDA